MTDTVIADDFQPQTVTLRVTGLEAADIIFDGMPSNECVTLSAHRWEVTFYARAGRYRIGEMVAVTIAPPDFRADGETRP